ncbi:hypothetical protein EXIGLDRAFT_376770 [Exidia glandulosa HHB12029]|uniref:Uncharacterized protein n=1 Tax=Exidia glandulosa HHB12029 TaxID=1314781 RepID=A0A166BPA8_EXIGL|nr:hypothetical protein EXIGLDRAFT_376770 [Exidia glandulosa HHB12029]
MHPAVPGLPACLPTCMTLGRFAVVPGPRKTKLLVAAISRAAALDACLLSWATVPFGMVDRGVEAAFELFLGTTPQASTVPYPNPTFLSGLLFSENLADCFLSATRRRERSGAYALGTEDLSILRC